MNKEQIKRILGIVRPAIIAMYGRGRDFNLTAYSQMGEKCLWVEVEAWYYDEWVFYKARLEDGKVTYLNRGQLVA